MLERSEIPKELSCLHDLNSAEVLGATTSVRASARPSIVGGTQQSLMPSELAATVEPTQSHARTRTCPAAALAAALHLASGAAWTSALCDHSGASVQA